MMKRKTFGLDGDPPSLEYVINFIHQYLYLRGSSNKLSAELNEKDIGHITKSAWFAFHNKMSPDEYIGVIVKAHKTMPNSRRFILPHQLSTHFSKNVAEIERLDEESAEANLEAGDDHFESNDDLETIGSELGPTQIDFSFMGELGDLDEE